MKRSLGQASSWLLRHRTPRTLTFVRRGSSLLCTQNSHARLHHKDTAVHRSQPHTISISLRPGYISQCDATRSFSSGAGDTPHQVLSLPALSPTMAKGNIPKWNKKEGDKVSVGEVLCLIETDKSTMEMEAMEEGYLAKILVPEGATDVAVGQPIAIMVEDEEDIGKVSIPSSTASSTPDSAPKPTPTPTETESGSQKSESVSMPAPSRQRLGPAVRKMLNEYQINVETLKGTGPGGTIVKGDVLAAIKTGNLSAVKPKLEGAEEAPSVSAQSTSRPEPSKPSSMSYDDIPTSQIRKIIAKRLLESKNGIPHLYLSADVYMDSTLSLRKEFKEKLGTSVSVNDFVIKAVASALKIVPGANAHWDEKAGEIVPGKSIDISIAVATDKGLITPIIKNADQKSLAEISAEVKVLAGKAREGKLLPHEFQGGTFSISNLGMFAVDHFCAIINPPQACILAVGRGVPSVDWQEDANDPKQGRPVAVTKMTVTLSADHRVVDVDVGGKFLDAFTGVLKNPTRLLL